MGLRAPSAGPLGWLPKNASYWLCVRLFGKQLHTYTSFLTRRHISSILSSFPHVLLSYVISLRIPWERACRLLGEHAGGAQHKFSGEVCKQKTFLRNPCQAG